jgi:broad specificity phosphatase PhoE
VRHGETAWSITGQHTGLSDLELTSRGEEQARALAPRLKELKFDHVLSSPLRRALRTCELAGFAGLTTLDRELVEWDYGRHSLVERPLAVTARLQCLASTSKLPPGTKPAPTSHCERTAFSRLRLEWDGLTLCRWHLVELVRLCGF